MSSFTEYHKKWKKENGKGEDSPYRQRTISEIQESTNQYLDSIAGNQGNIWDKIKSKASNNLNQSNNMQKVIDANTRNQMARNMENYVSAKRTAMQNVSNVIQENNRKQNVIKSKENTNNNDNKGKNIDLKTIEGRGQLISTIWDQVKYNTNQSIKQEANDLGRVTENTWLGGKSGIEQSFNYTYKAGRNHLKSEEMQKVENVINSSELNNKEKAFFINFQKNIDNSKEIQKQNKALEIASQKSNNVQGINSLTKKNGTYIPVSKRSSRILPKSEALETEKVDIDKIKKISETSGFDKIIEKDSEKIAENIDKQSNGVTKKLAELAPSIGNMAVGGTISAINPGAGTAYFTLSSAGSYYDDAKERGMSNKEAQNYAGIMGLMEGATEEISFGNFSKAGNTVKSLITKTGKEVAKDGIKEVGKTSIKTALKEYGIGIADNVMQESLIEPIQETVAGLVGGEDKANWENMGQRMLQSGIDGGLVAVITGGAKIGIDSCVGIVEKVRSGEKITQEDLKVAVKEASKEVDAEKMIIDSVQQQVNKYKDNNINQASDNVSQQLINRANNIINENNNLNLQQNTIKNQSNLATEQITNQENKISQNGNIEQIDNRETNKIKQNIILEENGVKHISKEGKKEDIYFRFDNKNGFKGKEHQSGISMWEERVDELLEPNYDYYEDYNGEIDFERAEESVNKNLEPYGIDYDTYNSMTYKEKMKLKREVALDEGYITDGASCFKLNDEGIEEFINYVRSNHAIDKYEEINFFTGKENGLGADGEYIVKPENTIYTNKTKEIIEILEDIDLTNEQKMNEIVNAINGNLANNGQTVYNNTESEGGIDGREEVRQRNRDVFEQSTNEINTKGQTTINAREGFEKRFKEATSKRIKDENISDNSKNNRKILKDVYNTDIFFIEDNIEFSGGADEKLNLINLTREIANSKDNNVVTGHELFEVIRNTREDIKNEYIEPLIDVVKDDNNFKEVLKKYVDNCQTKDKQLLLDNPRYIAKEILFDEAGFMFNEDEFKLGVNKQETDLIRFSDYLDSNKSILQIGLSNIEQKARVKNETLTNNKIEFNNIQKENISPYRTMEQIANDNTISDIQAFKEATEQLDTPFDRVLQQRENELNNKGIEKSPTIDYIKQKRSKEKASLTEIKDVLAQKFVNKGHYIDKLAKQINNDNLTYLYDRTLNTFNEAQISIGDYQINSKGERVGKSIIDIFEPAKKANLSLEFDDYLLNKHNVSRYAHEKGIFGSEISSVDSNKIVDYYEKKYPDFKEWSKEVSKYNDNNLRDLVDNGMVSEATYDKLKELYGNYVPTYRDITDNISQYVDDSVGNNTLGKATQSDKEILSIAESMAEQTLIIKKAIRMNNLGIELYNTIGKKNAETSKGVGFTDIAIQTLEGKVIEKANDGSNKFIIFQDGEMTKFKISDELYTAFAKDTLQNKINNSKVLKAVLTPVEKLSKAQRDLLTTYSIGFAIRNPFVDFQEGLFNSKYGGATFVKNWTKALYNIGTKGSWYESYKNNGGTANTYFNYSKGIIPIKTKNPVKKFWNAIKKVNEVIEQAPRLAEYISTIEHKGSIDEALYNAAEVTTNFKRGGEVTKAVNKYGANFLNASVQGLDKLYRNLSGQRGWKGYANILTKATLYMVAPAVINGLLLGDDEDYEDLPEYVKDEYFLFKTGEGKFFRIPKGRVSSVIGGIARRCLEAGQGKKVDWKSLVDTTTNQLAPNNPLKDNIFAPIRQAVKNEAWYGGEIVSSRLQKLPVAEQYDEKTDELSKFIGKKLNMSPKKINYVLEQYSGGIGDILLPMATPQAENNILEDKFTVDSVMKNKHVSEYYSTLEEMEKNANSQNTTDEDKLKYKYMSEASKVLSDLYNQKRDIQNSNKADKVKKEEVREVQKQINNIVEERLEKVENIKATNLTAKVGDSEYYKYNNEWTRLSDKEKEKNKNISLLSYADYKNKVYNLTKEKKNKGEITEEGQLKNKDKIEVLLNSKGTNREKEEIYKNYIGTEDKKIQLVDKLNFPLEEYLKYKQQDFKNDKDKNGESIAGTGKQKVYNYLNNISSYKLSDNYKKIICKIEGINDYDIDVVNFINDSNMITSNEKREILKNIGYEIDEDGYVITKSILPLRKYIK